MRVTYALILICILVFILQVAGFFPGMFELSPIELLYRPYLIITSMFGHGDILHILFNMIALFMFGSVLENRIGSARFLFLYLMSGIVGAIGFMVLNSPFEYALGASGAIYGVLGALVIIAPNLLVYFYGIPIPMYAAGPIYALIEIFGLGAADNIAHSAHLLGFFAGLVLALREGKEAWPPKPPMAMWKAIFVPIVFSIVVAMGFGYYFLSDPVNAKMLDCEGKDTALSARSCLLSLAAEYKNSPSQKGYICDEYDRYFEDNACRGV